MPDMLFAVAKYIIYIDLLLYDLPSLLTGSHASNQYP